MGKRVMIAMSGGVDSSVAAWLLLRQGYECMGVTMKLYNNETVGAPRGHSCCALDDVEDARSVARRLGIAHYVFNFQDEFDQDVIQRFAQSYARGDTPNPCIDCNRYLKFGALFQRAKMLGIDYIATGHYARICLTPSNGRWALRKGRDPSRDQSYVLASMTQEQLAHTLFPLGSFYKPEARRIAQEAGFINARKHDSQDICFVPDGDYAAFLERYTGERFQPGDILDQRDGHVWGRHRGAIRYTLGQRRGLGISAPEPLYVCAKSMRENTVTIGPEAALYHSILFAEDWVWGAIPALREPMRVTAKVRYSQRESPAVAEPMENGTVRLTFDQPQRAITTGQAVVLYQEDTVLGGGTITAVSDRTQTAVS